MNNLLNKLNGEIGSFILVQFLGFAIGMISALGFNVVFAISANPYAKEASIIAAALGFLISGLSDFFIHRSAVYLRTFSLVKEHVSEALYDIQTYEEKKEKHSFSWIVAAAMIMVWGFVSAFVWDGYPETFTNLTLLRLGVLYFVATLVFALGAKAGSGGWKLEKN